MNLGESIRSGVKWLAFGRVGNRFMEFAFGVILARLLVPADFGMIVTIQIFTGFVGMFTAGGMGQSLIRAKDADEDDFSAVFTLQLTTGVLVYAGFFFAAPWIARFFEDPLYTDLIRVSALSFLLRPMLVMRSSWLNREMNFRSRTLVEVATGFFTGIASTGMALLGLGVWSLTLSGLFAGLFKNLWLARLTPLRVRLNPDVAVMRRHAGYGAKIVGNDFITYLRNEAKILILSKMAGPAFLGLFNKAESLSRLPNQLLMSPTMEPLFRAMSKVQEDLDQIKYLYYRTITLLTAYTVPVYVLLWWIAEPFIAVVYGPKWIEAGAPMSILAIAGLFLNIVFPTGVLLAARNRLGMEMLAQGLNLLVVAAAAAIGLQWGLEGVAWGIVASQALLALHFYALVPRVLPTRLADLVRSLGPGLMLGGLMFAVLALAHFGMRGMHVDAPAVYLSVMAVCGGLCYGAAFLLLPIPALQTESARWRQRLAAGLAHWHGRRT